MIDGKTVFGIIPARSGSKGLPGKNIRNLCGKPLIAWSIEKALKSRFLDAVVVSTDSQEIADIAKSFGAEVPFIRPPSLAGDTSSTYDVIRHALEHYRLAENRSFDYCALLEPTSPLREDGDIDAMLAKLHGGADDFDSIVSLGEVREHPSIMKRLVGDTIEPFCGELPLTNRRQENPPAYFPYGVAYIAKTPVLLDQNTFYTQRCTYHLIQRYQNYEIDDIYDFFCVENVMRHEWGMT